MTAHESITVLGTTADWDACDLCGKPELKHYVVIDIDGEVGRYGVVCAAHLVKWGAADIRKAATKADREREARDRERMHVWCAFASTIQKQMWIDWLTLKTGIAIAGMLYQQNGIDEAVRTLGQNYFTVNKQFHAEMGLDWGAV